MPRPGWTRTLRPGKMSPNGPSLSAPGRRAAKAWKAPASRHCPTVVACPTLTAPRLGGMARGRHRPGHPDHPRPGRQPGPGLPLHSVRRGYALLLPGRRRVRRVRRRDVAPRPPRVSATGAACTSKRANTMTLSLQTAIVSILPDSTGGENQMRQCEIATANAQPPPPRPPRGGGCRGAATIVTVSAGHL
jgi:hypothetical protein